MDFLKAEQVGSAKWRVLAIPFGGPFKGGKDSDDEFFSPRTDIKPDWFAKRPVIWHHGLDASIKDEDLEMGTEDDLEKTAEGWWATMWLDRANRYWAEVNKFLTAGKLHGSSGAIGHLVKKDYNTGEILQWPHAEQTLTLTPANPYSRVTVAKAVDWLSPAGTRGLLSDLDDLRPDLPSGGEDAAIARAKALALARAYEALSKNI